MKKDTKKEYKEYIKHHEDIFKNKKDGTKLIHSGNEPDYIHGSLVVPLSLSTTYAQHEPGNPFGEFDYSRCGNPTREHLERQLAAIENAKHCITFSSGCGATTTIIQMVRSGEEVICIDDVYGGTQRIFRKISAITHDVKYNFTCMNDLNKVKSLLNEKTRIVWVESPTNPTLKFTDVPELVKIVKNYNKDILVVVDNTFLTPYNCKPLDLGADIVVESATKYLGGHSDLVMGVIGVNDTELHDKLYFIAKSIGANPSPFECWLLIRGLKTLHLRVERSNSSALIIAKFLSSHKKVLKISYAGLESSPYHEIMKKQSKSAGGIISVTLDTNYDGTRQFIKNLKIITLAESLGAVESLIDHPVTMTHGSVPKEIREELGIVDSFVRLSIGCEDVEDLINDLDFALSQL